MKALYIELALLWILITASNFIFYTATGHWVNLLGGILSAIQVFVKIYYVGKES